MALFLNPKAAPWWLGVTARATRRLEAGRVNAVPIPDTTTNSTKIGTLPTVAMPTLATMYSAVPRRRKSAGPVLSHSQPTGAASKAAAAKYEAKTYPSVSTSRPISARSWTAMAPARRIGSTPTVSAAVATNVGVSHLSFPPASIPLPLGSMIISARA